MKEHLTIKKLAIKSFLDDPVCELSELRNVAFSQKHRREKVSYQIDGVVDSLLSFPAI